jgi:hypothetical protein
MSETGVPNQHARRILACLADFKRRSLKEVTDVYNQRYPPGLRLFKTKQGDIQKVLNALVVEQYMSAELFSFTNEPIPLTKLYVLTNAGFRVLQRHR